MCDFYTELYKSSNIDSNNIQSYLNTTTVSQIINDKQRIELDKFPSMKECDEAVKMLKPNKSPGLDGLPGEFYHTFWNELKPYFYNSLSQTFNQKCHDIFSAFSFNHA
jgi:hypothetical protein